MKKKFLVFGLLACSLALPFAAQAARVTGAEALPATSATSAAPAAPVASAPVTASAIDWAEGVVTVKGMGIAPPDAVSAAQAEMLAKRAAVLDAYRQLAEEIQGVRVDAESTVERMMLQSDVIRTKVSACVKGARILGERILPNGAYEVTMSVAMYGVSDSLAAAVLPRPQRVEPFPAMTPDVAPAVPAPSDLRIRVSVSVTNPSTGGGESASRRQYSAGSLGEAPLLGILSQDAAVRPRALAAAAPSGQPMYSAYPWYYPPYPMYPPYPYFPPQPSYPPTGPQTPPADSQTQPSEPPAVQEPEPVSQPIRSEPIGGFTSLVVDCTGMGLEPAMSPVLKNEAGEAIYGASNLDYDIVTTRGMAAYAKADTLDKVSRVGSNPLIVKCTALEANHINPIISVADANRVLLENEETKFLNDLNVVLVR